MKDKIFFDTNLLIYLFDRSEQNKHLEVKKIVNSTRRKGNLCISSQVINEFINVITGKIENPISFKEVKGKINLLKEIFDIFPLTFNTSMSAINVKIENNISYWDSLIVASSIENGCSILYSEDLHDGQIIDNKVKVVNPFLLSKNT